MNFWYNVRQIIESGAKTNFLGIKHSASTLGIPSPKKNAEVMSMARRMGETLKWNLRGSMHNPETEVEGKDPKGIADLLHLRVHFHWK